MEILNKRQLKILSAVVEEYTKTALPVGSSVLSREYDFEVSSATLRNDMVKLEKKGFLYQPHTSAGRIPTDTGYRYFVRGYILARDTDARDPGHTTEISSSFQLSGGGITSLLCFFSRSK